MSGKAGQFPGRWVVTRIRGGDIDRAVAVVPGKFQGRCREEGCTWPGPFGLTPHNLGRSLYRHTRKTGHTTRLSVVEVTEYRRPE